MQFMLQMMQGNQMQFKHGFLAQQFPMFAEMQGGNKPGDTKVTSKIQTQDDKPQWVYTCDSGQGKGAASSEEAFLSRKWDDF
jgi:hypothetical protein